MTSRDQFLKGIGLAKTWGDRSTRMLVFADWLEERGDKEAAGWRWIVESKFIPYGLGWDCFCVYGRSKGDREYTEQMVALPDMCGRALVPAEAFIRIGKTVISRDAAQQVTGPTRVTIPYFPIVSVRYDRLPDSLGNCDTKQLRFLKRIDAEIIVACAIADVELPPTLVRGSYTELPRIYING